MGDRSRDVKKNFATQGDHVVPEGDTIVKCKGLRELKSFTFLGRPDIA